MRDECGQKGKRFRRGIDHPHKRQAHLFVDEKVCVLGGQALAFQGIDDVDDVVQDGVGQAFDGADSSAAKLHQSGNGRRAVRDDIATRNADENLIVTNQRRIKPEATCLRKTGKGHA